MELGFEMLVVLLPAIATAVLAIAIEVVPKLVARLHTLMRNASDVEWLNHLVMHSAFFGTAIGTVLGLKKESNATAYVAVVWFVALLYISRMLCSRIEELEEEKERALHRKTAGTIRSIVRNELQKAASSNNGGWSD